ncbi:hypothetical protein A9Q99_01185 [Gammaproteobacteria bacterium 45_16_T64]|nr:hypothetical protein A9Q99_01185 [Gammaproteobacteria bacterium 45_16_T64]
MLIQTPPSKADEAYRLLEDKIVTLGLAPGQWISEKALIDELSVGRTPIREALQRLAVDKLVEILPRKGMRVSEINIQQQMRLLEVRRPLEAQLVILAVARVNTDQQHSLIQLAQDMQQCAANHDVDGFSQLDTYFNQLLLTIADNEFLTTMLVQLHGLSRRFWMYQRRHSPLLAANSEQELKDVAALHVNIANAIANKDRDSVLAATQQHMDYVQRFTTNSIL